MVVCRQAASVLASLTKDLLELNAWEDSLSSQSQLPYTPRCGSGPKYRWRALPLHPAWDPSPPHQTGPPRPGLPEHGKKSQGGLGGRGRERAGRKGLWLEGRVLQLQWGDGGGDLPNTSWGQTHIWGLPKLPYSCSHFRRLPSSGKEKTHKHKQIYGIVPGLGGCQKFVYVVFSGYLLWGRKNT